jgi:hypothetical protein
MQNWGKRENLINEKAISVAEEQRSRRRLDHCFKSTNKVRLLFFFTDLLLSLSLF